MATKLIVFCIYLYCRISVDQQGRAEGVQAQEKWGREYAAMHWPGIPVKVFTDNDLSASKDDVTRPGFEQMREGIRRGECAHLWVVEQSRLTRREPEWFSLAADLVKAGVTEIHTKRGGVVSVEGVVAGIMAVLGAHEIRQLRKRLNDKLGELAAEGRPHGHAGFAYRHRILTGEQQLRLEQWWQARDEARQRGEDMARWREDNPRPAGGAPVLDSQGRAAVEVDPARAELLRWAAARVLDGWTLTNITREFRRQGARGACGGQITVPALRQMLTNASVAGFRQYRGEIVGRAIWEPVLDEATWRAVRGRLETGRQERRRPARRYLLVNFAFCASCKCAMHGAYMTRRDKSYYRCNAGEIDGRCGRMHIQVEPTDRHVIGKLGKHLAEQDLAGPEDPAAGDRDRIIKALASVDQQRAEWMAARDAGQLNLAEFLAAKAKFDASQQQLERDLAGLPEPLKRLTADQFREGWPEMTLDEQRQVLGDWIEKIIVHPRIPKITMLDVAVKAGVSQSQVFRTYHDDPRLAEATVSAVRAAAEELGYEHQPGGGVHFDPDRIEIIWRR
jgi:site-specific DNA recombinase